MASLVALEVKFGGGVVVPVRLAVPGYFFYVYAIFFFNITMNLKKILFKYIKIFYFK